MDYKKEIYQTYNSSDLYKNNKSIIPYKDWNWRYKTYLPQSKHASVLELGCGKGEFIAFLVSNGYNNVSGVDISDDQINMSLKEIRKHLIKDDFVHFIENDFRQYDLIIMRDVLEHFTKKQVYEILYKCNSRLKSGGKLLIQIPNGEGLFFGTIFYSDFTHETAFTKKSMYQVLSSTGFINIKTIGVKPGFFSLTSIIRTIFWEILVMPFKFLKVIETQNLDLILTRNIITTAEKS